jgi:hypothetical protein
MKKMVKVSDFLTDAEIGVAVAMYFDREAKEPFAQRFAVAVTRPQIARINASLGEENDPYFLAYFVQYILSLRWQSDEGR